MTSHEEDIVKIGPTIRRLSNRCAMRYRAGSRALASFGRARRGSSALEFALIGPIFTMLLFGIVVYGIYFATWILVTEAASEAARASLAGMSATERQSLATTTATQLASAYAPLVNPSSLSVSFPTPSNPNLFSVSIAYNFANSSLSSLINFIPLPTTTPSVTVTVSNGGY
jgi:Flp pilus assembly protein TadG